MMTRARIATSFLATSNFPLSPASFSQVLDPYLRRLPATVALMSEWNYELAPEKLLIRYGSATAGSGGYRTAVATYFGRQLHSQATLEARFYVRDSFGFILRGNIPLGAKIDRY